MLPGDDAVVTGPSLLLSPEDMDIIHYLEHGELVQILEINEAEVPIKILCVEFDQPTSPVRIWQMVKRLTRLGYALISIDAWNYTFVWSHASATPQTTNASVNGGP